MKYRNETASLQNQLEESKHQEMLLKQIMNEKEEAYLDAVSELEQTNIQLELMKQSSKKHLAKLVGEE
jgi:PHD/YefM family antitoxin component YafN of YafNO toxin-antitoxin module